MLLLPKRFIRFGSKQREHSPHRPVNLIIHSGRYTYQFRISVRLVPNVRAHKSMLYGVADSYMHVKLLAWLGNLFVVIQGFSHNDDIVQEALSCYQFLMACRFLWGVCIIKQSVTFLALQIFPGVSML